MGALYCIKRRLVHTTLTYPRPDAFLHGDRKFCGSCCNHSIGLRSFNYCEQRDQIRRFLTVLGNNFIAKVAQKFGELLGNKKSITFEVKLLCLYFCQFLKKLGYFLFYHLPTLIVNEHSVFRERSSYFARAKHNLPAD